MKSLDKSNYLLPNYLLVAELFGKNDRTSSNKIEISSSLIFRFVDTGILLNKLWLAKFANNSNNNNINVNNNNKNVVNRMASSSYF